jgi:hypothetical protein
MANRPTSQDVLLALLALDAYSRGENAQLLSYGYGNSALNSPLHA